MDNQHRQNDPRDEKQTIRIDGSSKVETQWMVSVSVGSHPKTLYGEMEE